MRERETEMEGTTEKLRERGGGGKKKKKMMMMIMKIEGTTEKKEKTKRRDIDMEGGNHTAQGGGERV